MQTGTSGGGNNPWMGGDRTQDTVGSLFLQFHEQKDRELRGFEIVDLMRQRTSQIPGIVVEVQEMEMGPPVGKDVQIQFSSNHRDILEPVVARVRDYLDAEVSGLRDVADTRSLPGIEWTLTVDKAQAALYGADVTLVGIAVQLVTNGLKVGEYRPDGADEAVDIRVRYPDGERGFRALDELTLTTARGRVPISNFVTRSAVPNVDTVQRIDGKIVEYIRANVLPGVLADDKVDEIQAWLDTQVFDSRVNIDFRGANEEQNQSMDFIVKAMIMSVLLMFVLLVTQFNSFYQASLILFAVVMSTAGVLLGLAITGMPFSAILTGVGIVALAGIVVNNNIVLIDTYNRIRREEPSLDYISIIVRTGAHRLRPVCLTAATTVLGLLPLASNWSIDFVNRTAYYGSSVSSFWVPLAQAIVFGLTFATLLTLVSTPAMLAIPHQIQNMSFHLQTQTRARGLQAESR
jgi:multidrug efflux pump